MLRNYLAVTLINPPERATTVTNSCDKELYTFCIMAFAMVWKGKSGHHRAIDIFSNLRVWDTEENSEVLIYL